MDNALVFLVLLIAVSSYAGLCGGAPERIGAAIIFLGSILTYAVPSSSATDYLSVEFGIFLIDLACLAAFLILALFAERFWPLWLTALQIIGVAGHAVKGADPDTIRRAYAFVLAFWSYPMLFLIALGTWRHRQRLARNGVDPSWSSFSTRSGPEPPAGPTA